MSRYRLGVVLATLVSAAACGSTERGEVDDLWTTLDGWPEYRDEAVRAQGIVRPTEVEGGGWVIRDPSGPVWSPLDLPEAFRIDGAEVVADVRLRPDLLSVGMTGALAEVLRIRYGRVEGAPAAAEAEDTAARRAPGARLRGLWRVVGAHHPGVSAMSEAEAGRWRGRTFEYSDVLSRAPGGECLSPIYRERQAPVDGLMSGLYGIPRERLAPVADLDEVTVVDISCGAPSWDGAGQTVLLLDDRRALTPWDGVFFELRRVN